MLTFLVARALIGAETASMILSWRHTGFNTHSRAPRTVAEYLVIVEHYQPELIGENHRDWPMKRRRKVKAVRPLPSESMTPMVTALEKGGSMVSGKGEIVDPGGSGEADSKRQPRSKGRTGSEEAPKRRSKK